MREDDGRIYFFDTSALVKRYHREVGTDIVDAAQLAVMKRLGLQAIAHIYCADRMFAALIEEEGFPVINPEESPVV